jgi:hypothetical protein
MEYSSSGKRQLSHTHHGIVLIGDIEKDTTNKMCHGIVDKDLVDTAVAMEIVWQGSYNLL